MVAIIEKLDFLADTLLLYRAGERTVPLRGWGGDQTTPDPADTGEPTPEIPNQQVALVKGDRWLTLWPLCDYGVARRTSLEGTLGATAESPLVFLRAEPERLLFAALGVDLPHGERREPLAEFRALFRLSNRVASSRRSGESPDFEDEIQRDSDALIGRRTEVARAKQVVKESQQGVVWISGPGGIGKSFLMAKLADDLRGNPKHVCRVAWRFKSSRADTCNRVAFFRHSIEKIAAWLGKEKDEGFRPAPESDEQQRQLEQLLAEVAKLEASDSRARPPRVLFILDGLDEIARSDPGFAELPFRLCPANVVWLCAGRPEGNLPEIFDVGRDHCRHVFEDGLPLMSRDDIRAMLLENSGSLKYDLLSLDEERTSGVEEDRKMEIHNTAVEAIVERAGGLPLFVHFVIEDILSGHFRYTDLESRLPSGLSAYYDELLKRIGVGELQGLLTPLVVTLAWSRAPLDEETLHFLMVRRQVVTDDDVGRELLRRGLETAQSMIRSVAQPGKDLAGYELFHPTFESHLCEDAGGVIGQQNPLTRESFRALARDWRVIPESHSARLYALRHGPMHLIEMEKWDDLIGDEESPGLLCDLRFIEAKCGAGLGYDLSTDYKEAMARLPELREEKEKDRAARQKCVDYVNALAEYARKQRAGEEAELPEPPKVLEPSAGLDTEYTPSQEEPTRTNRLQRFGGFYFGNRHVITEEANLTLSMAVNQAENGLIFEQGEKFFDPSSRLWLRSERRSPEAPLHRACTAVLSGCGGVESAVVTSGDFTRAISVGMDKSLRVWDMESGICRAVLEGHSWSIDTVAVNADFKRAISGGADKTLRVWDLESGKCSAVLEGHAGLVTAVAASADFTRAISSSFDKTLRLWDLENGQCLSVFEGHADGVEAVAASADFTRAISGSLDKTLRVWDLESGRCWTEMKGHTGAVKAVASSADFTRMISGSDDRTLRVWDLNSGKCQTVIEGHEGGIQVVAASADFTRAISGSDDKSLRVWDLERGRCRVVLEGHSNSIRAVSASVDFSRAISGSFDKTLRIWDLNRGGGAGSASWPFGSGQFGVSQRRFLPCYFG